MTSVARKAFRNPSLFQKIRRLALQIARTSARQIANRWQPFSRLFLLSDSDIWVISGEMRELVVIAQQIGIRIASSRWLGHAKNQCVFYGSHFDLLEPKWVERPHRLGTAYFHGRPGIGVPGFDAAYENLRKHHKEIHRIQVSHSDMRDVVLSSGIAADKVFLIPIGVNLSYFPTQTREARLKMRAKYGIPESAVVVGSFQKDGVGWGEGLEPKRVKGPDVFLRTIEILKPRVPELFVLLSGPARGYLKAGLARIGVPYRHVYLKHYPDLGELYETLNLYIIASREEGGPKALLESMASGVPVVTTRVGQAMDLVVHERNGWLVQVEDVEGLAYWAEYALSHSENTAKILYSARATAEDNSYAAQIPLWQRLFQGFVECRI